MQKHTEVNCSHLSLQHPIDDFVCVGLRKVYQRSATLESSLVFPVNASVGGGAMVTACSREEEASDGKLEPVAFSFCVARQQRNGQTSEFHIFSGFSDRLKH